MDKADSKYCGCLYYSSNALARVMTKIAAEEFSVTGLTPSYAFLIMIINDKPGIQPKEISEQMQLTPSTVTRLIEKMEHRGLLTRNSIGRCTEVIPTEEGAKLNVQIKDAWRKLYNRYMVLLGEKVGMELTSSIYNASKKLEE